MQADLRQFLARLIGTIALALVPVVFTAFVTMGDQAELREVSLLAHIRTHVAGHKRSIATGSFREPQLDWSTVHRMPGWKVGSISRLSNLRDAPVNERLRSCGH